MLQEVDSSQIFTDEQPDENVMEVTLAQFDELVLDKKALDELIENPNYQRIIGSKYMQYEYDRLCGLLKSRNQAVIKDRDTIVSKIVAIGYLEQFIEALQVGLNGIDNPEQRRELLRQIEAYEQGESTQEAKDA